MADTFTIPNREQRYLLPPSIQDWLPEEHLARFIVDIVDELDLTPITRAYQSGGCKAYHPSCLLSLLFYGYATGIYSSRKLEQATYDSIAFRFITADTHPDHDTIAEFRRRFLPELKALFAQILVLAHEMGLMKLGKVSLDGSKVKANASKHHALSYKHACKLEKQLESEIEELMRLAEETDYKERNEGMKIPDELKRRKDRLVVIKEAKGKIEARAKQRYEEEQKEYEDKMAERQAKEERTGKKTRGKAPTPPDPEPRDKDQVNLTDEESRVMLTGKGFEQCYNAQASVDTETMLIVGEHVSQATNDKKEMQLALEALNNLPEQLGKVETMLADAGYYSKDNVELCEKEDIKAYIPPGRDQHNKPLKERFEEPEPLPEEATPAEEMRHKLQTKKGRELYAQRKSTVEPVFGIIKQVLGFRQFSLRGHKLVSGEWTLVSIAWNLKRIFNLKGEKTQIA